ncbi:MAG: TolC family protein, partial [Thermodesulfovibrionales bacterium]
MIVSSTACWPAGVSFASILFAFGFSEVVGISFGFHSACKACLLDPMAALRCEKGRGRLLRSKKAFFVALFILTIFAGGETIASAEVLTLSQGLKLVTEDSRVLKITRQQESISEADAVIAKAKMLPEINASLNQTFLAHQPYAVFGTLTVPSSDKDFYAFSLSVQQTLYDFKGNASRYEASKAILETKRLDTRRVRNLVAIDFALIYFDLLESEKTIVVVEKEVRSLEAHLGDAQSLYMEGAITKNDLLQAEVRLADARQRLVSARNSRAINVARLNSALARPLDADAEAIDIAEMPGQYITPELEKTWEVALNNRLEIKIVDETLRSLGLEATSAKSEFYPKFFVEGGYDYTENRYVEPEGNWQLIAGMSFNIFKGGSTRAAVMKIENEKLQLLQQKAKL